MCWGRSNPQNCEAHIWCCPTPATTIASPPVSTVELLDHVLLLDGALPRILFVLERVNFLSFPQAARVSIHWAPGRGWSPVERLLGSAASELEVRIALASPTIGTSAWRTLLISAGSTSAWMIIACGAKVDTCHR